MYEGKNEMALKEIDKVLSIAKDIKLPEWQAYVSLNKCRIALESGNIDMAETSIKACKEVIKNSELPAYSVNNLKKRMLFSEALISAKLKGFKEAATILGNYEKLIKQGDNPKEMENVHQLSGLIALEQDMFDKAIKELSQADQQNPYTLFNLGVAYSNSGNREKANTFYKKAAEWNVNGLNYAIIRNEANKALTTVASDD